MTISETLIFLSFLILLMDSSRLGRVGMVVALGLQLVDWLWIMRKCKQECLLLSLIVARTMQAEVSRRPALTSLRVSVGAFATYIRFSLPQAGNK